MRGADRQLELLERLQALLRESKYTTTYKFALLHALCDLAGTGSSLVRWYATSLPGPS
jgi:hypothetical protein